MKQSLSTALNALEKRIRAEFAPHIAEARRVFREDARIANNPNTGRRNAARHEASSFRRLQELERAMDARLSIVNALRENRELIDAGVLSAADVLKSINDGSLTGAVSELGEILGKPFEDKVRRRKALEADMWERSKAIAVGIRGFVSPETHAQHLSRCRRLP